MIDFGRSHGGVFASASLVAHLVRGVFAALVMITAVKCQTAAPLASLALGVAALGGVSSGQSIAAAYKRVPKIPVQPQRSRLQSRNAADTYN
jgi:hypothetical protein